MSTHIARRKRPSLHQHDERDDVAVSVGDTASATTAISNCVEASQQDVRRRKSARGNSSISELAREIVVFQKKTVIIAGAGISVASGVRPFRGTANAVWTNRVWTTATREAFRKNTLEWYNDFWIPCMLTEGTQHKPKPNPAHFALDSILQYTHNVHVITQNVDGLHPPSPKLIEAHGRLGLYKCIPAHPDDDSDTDSDSDDDDERLVHLGHRRKRRLHDTRCQYQQHNSVEGDDLPIQCQTVLESSKGLGRLTHVPTCPDCNNPLAPQALLFDEGYHSHDYYQFRVMEELLSDCQVLVFCGTSFHVRLPEIALEHARARDIPVYNFNTQDLLEATTRLNATNIKGPAEESLPRLWEQIQAYRYLQQQQQQQQQQGQQMMLDLATNAATEEPAPITDGIFVPPPPSAAANAKNRGSGAIAVKS